MRRVEADERRLGRKAAALQESSLPASSGEEPDCHTTKNVHGEQRRQRPSRSYPALTSRTSFSKNERHSSRIGYLLHRLTLLPRTAASITALDALFSSPVEPKGEACAVLHTLPNALHCTNTWESSKPQSLLRFHLPSSAQGSTRI